MNLARLLAVLLVLYTVDSWAQWYNPNTGAPVPDTESRKRSGDFGAMLTVTGDVKSFLDEWYKTAESHTPHLKTKDKVKRGEIIGALLFFSGCGIEGGKCDATVDFKVLSPNGSVYGEHNGSRVWSGSAARKGVVLLSQARLEVRIEPNDPIGEYVVLASLKDSTPKSVFQLMQKFQVVE
jgi:hypothetical protein